MAMYSKYCFDMSALLLDLASQRASIPHGEGALSSRVGYQPYRL